MTAFLPSLLFNLGMGASDIAGPAPGPPPSTLSLYGNATGTLTLKGDETGTLTIRGQA